MSSTTGTDHTLSSGNAGGTTIDNTDTTNVNAVSEKEGAQARSTQITFEDAPHPASHEPKALYVPSPREREQGI